MVGYTTDLPRLVYIADKRSVYITVQRLAALLIDWIFDTPPVGLNFKDTTVGPTATLKLRTKSSRKYIHFSLPLGNYLPLLKKETVVHLVQNSYKFSSVATHTFCFSFLVNDFTFCVTFTLD